MSSHANAAMIEEFQKQAQAVDLEATESRRSAREFLASLKDYPQTGMNNG